MVLITFIEQYNNYFWPMLITKDPDLQLVSAGLRSFFVEGGAYGLAWPQIYGCECLHHRTPTYSLPVYPEDDHAEREYYGWCEQELICTTIHLKREEQQ